MSDAAGNKAGGQRPVKRRRGTRALRTAVVVLLLGALVNVLVAWGCVIAAPAFLRAASTASATEAAYEPLFPHRPFLFTGQGGIITHWWGMAEIEVLQMEAIAGSLHWMDRGKIWRAGWPYPSLACATIFGDSSVNGGFRVWGLTSSVPCEPPRPFPCRPQWPGFAANTAFYAAILTGGFLGFSWLRHRHRPGTCRSCRYDLSGITSGVCPECGGKV